MDKTLFSVITVSFNSEKTIKRTIESLLNQSFQNFEYIIIDGKSTDKTLEIIKSFEKEFKRKEIYFTWISEKDKGIYHAFNKGVKKATGKWVSFLGSDDFYLSNALENYSKEIFKIKQDIDLVYSNVEVKDRKIIRDIWTWKTFRKKMNIAHVGAFHNIKYFKKYGLFNENYKIAGDYELLLRANKKLKSHWFDKVTAVMGDGGISNDNIIEVYKETTNVKIDTKSQSKITSKIDFYIWIVKYRIKTIINEITR
ncbi:glycosyltransferase family 2 protein [Polaribacter aquimarinus]|uniref:Glycosyltransferase n=1 Tax=Polaribacter aquimarinus TaxID=2100726 RepID=A0A2U2JBE9_9FLAO|nr:glycosyltransferase family 2 protein [Polaribacter aquimarinus]PWG05601.1 glycosyltransferase [Polaribacter aquimarinus]